jgi:hypothetical protein
MKKKQSQFNQQREERIIGFFVAKGLLIAPHISPKSSIKIAISDVIEVGLTKEPRVLEVLPAALLHFPRSFLGHHEMPPKLKQVLDNIRAGKLTGPTIGGIRYEAMLRWANEPLPDKRTTLEKDRKVMKAFRLKRSAIQKLKEGAAALCMNESEYIESLLLRD